MTPSITELTNRFLSRSRGPAAPDSMVEPYDVATAFRVEPRLAWTETLAVLKALGDTSTHKMPSEWASTVRNQPPATLMPMAFGFYPQMVSDLSLLLRPTPQGRLIQPTVTGTFQHPDAILNQQAAAEWVADHVDSAVKLWQSMTDSAVKSFNLGLAALSRGQKSAAIAQLTAAAKGIPDSSGWKSLAELYSSLASTEA